MKRKTHVFALLGVFAVAALFLSVLFGTVSAAPAASVDLAAERANRVNAVIAPSSQVTGSVDVNIQQQPQQQTGTGGQGGATTTTQTTNVGINIPWWVWLVGLLLLVLIVGLIAGSRGGNTTVIKD
jgi:hypothetical protein